MTIYAVNSTKGKAEAFIDAHEAAVPEMAGNYEVVEFVIDQPDPWVMPADPTPLADVLEVREMGRRHREPIE